MRHERTRRSGTPAVVTSEQRPGGAAALYMLSAFPSRRNRPEGFKNHEARVPPCGANARLRIGRKRKSAISSARARIRFQRLMLESGRTLLARSVGNPRHTLGDCRDAAFASDEQRLRDSLRPISHDGELERDKVERPPRPDASRDAPPVAAIGFVQR